MIKTRDSSLMSEEKNNWGSSIQRILTPACHPLSRPGGLLAFSIPKGTSPETGASSAVDLSILGNLSLFPLFTRGPPSLSHSCQRRNSSRICFPTTSTCQGCTFYKIRWQGASWGQSLNYCYFEDPHLMAPQIPLHLPPTHPKCRDIPSWLKISSTPWNEEGSKG